MLNGMGRIELKKLYRDLSETNTYARDASNQDFTLAAARAILWRTRARAIFNGDHILIDGEHNRIYKENGANRQVITIYSDDIAVSNVPHSHELDADTIPLVFLLDLCLSPERAEETLNGLQDVYENRWLKRYTPAFARTLCCAHVIGIIASHHSSKISKFVGVALGFLGLKQLRGWLSG